MDDRKRKTLIDVAELAIVLAAAMLPQFAMAESVGRDELAKTGSGAVTAGIIFSIYRKWKSEE